MKGIYKANLCLPWPDETSVVPEVFHKVNKAIYDKEIPTQNGDVYYVCMDKCIRCNARTSACRLQVQVELTILIASPIVVTDVLVEASLTAKHIHFDVKLPHKNVSVHTCIPCT